ncbi:MAG: AAA family ATPase [Thermodesulfobacteriota bacterium]|nr:AAA family ATPase [Thermodesulfobacteriota bacterium]
MTNPVKSHFEGRYSTFYQKYLQRVTKIGGQEYKAPCPFHEDKDPSFNFNNQTGQYFCHGCGKKGDAIHFFAGINSLDTRRDFPKILKGIASDFNIPLDNEKRRLVKTYDYKDLEGKLLFQVCRYDPKDFRQRRPNGKGWTWNLRGIEPVLYCLSEIVKTPEVIIVEGEKDADTLHGLGFIATTSPMGAKKWRPEYNQYLRGKHVILCPDNDNEGREHMALVGSSLNGTVASLKMIELPGLPSKGDVSDWVGGFSDKTGAAEKLAMMIEGAGPYEPPKKATLEDAVLESTDFRALDLPEKKMLLAPWLTEDALGLDSGWRGAGKTWMALGILDAVTTGQPFGPWEPGDPVPCLFLDGEMPVQDVRARLRDTDHGIERKAPLYIYSDSYANQLGLPRAHLASEKWRTTMKRILLTRHIKLWVVDNLASLASGLDENSKKDWDPINSWLLELRFAGISTIMLHHVGKEGNQRGTSAREDNLDFSITLKRPHDYTPEDGCRFILHFSKARVATEHLPLLQDHEFKLVHDETGRLVWTWGSTKKQNKVEVIRMLDEGMTQGDIAQALGIHKGTVSKIRRQAIEDGLLSKKNKLTQSGFETVHN